MQNDAQRSQGIGDELLARAIVNLEVVAERQQSAQIAAIAAGMKSGQIGAAAPMFRAVAETYAKAPQLPASMRADAFLDLAAVLLHEDRDKAIEALQTALEIAPDHPASLAFLSHIRLENHEFDAARPLLERLTGLADAADADRWKAMGFGDLGVLHHTAGEFDAAAACYAEAIARLRKLGDEVRLAETLSNSGLIDRRQKHHAEAGQQFAAALDIWQRLGREPETVRLLGYLASVRFASGAWDEAMALFARRSELNVRLEDAAELAADLANIGLVGIRKGDAALACRHFHKALELYRGQGLTREAQSVAALIARHGCTAASAA